MMDESLTISELVNGLNNDAMKNHRLILSQLLINKVADKNDICEEEVSAVFSTIFTLLTNCNPTIYAEIINNYIILLSNLSISEKNVFICISNLNSSSDTSKSFELILNKFLNYNTQLEVYDESIESYLNDPLQFFGHVLCNLCQSDEGRKLLLAKSTNNMCRLVLQLKSRNLIRRKGSISCLRSCLFDNNVHWWMLNEIKILNLLLIPLIVAIPFTPKEKENMDPLIWLQAENPEKKCDPDNEIIKMLLECIILLCQRRGLREELRKRKVYLVVRNLHLKIEDESISESIYEIVDLLMGDEDPRTIIDKEGEEISLI